MNGKIFLALMAAVVLVMSFFIYRTLTGERVILPREAFFVAAERGDIGILGRMLETVPDLLTARSEQGKTALVIAVEGRQLKSVEFLINAGADPLLRDANGAQPLELSRTLPFDAARERMEAVSKGP
jgi:hypothetical protein